MPSVRLYILFVVGATTLVFCLIITAIRWKTPLRNVVRTPSLRVLRTDPTREIDAAQEFARKFLRGYRTVLNDKVPVNAYSQFAYSPTTNVGADLWISAISESLLRLYPDKSSRIEVHATSLDLAP